MSRPRVLASFLKRPHVCVGRRRARCSEWCGQARRLRGSSFPLLTPRAPGGPAPSHIRRPRRRPTRSLCARSTAASCCKPTATRTCTTGSTPSTRSWPGPYGTRLRPHGPPCSGWGEGGRSEDVRLLLRLLPLVTCESPRRSRRMSSREGAVMQLKTRHARSDLGTAGPGGREPRLPLRPLQGASRGQDRVSGDEGSRDGVRDRCLSPHPCRSKLSRRRSAQMRV